MDKYTIRDKQLEGIDLEKGKNHLIYGLQITKMKGKNLSSSHKRPFYLLETDFSQLQWISNNKKFRDSRIDLKTVTSIDEKSNMLSANKAKSIDTSKFLCIHYNEKDELGLQFDSPQLKKEWWLGLDYFVFEAKNDNDLHHIPTRGLKKAPTQGTGDSLANDIFLRADADGSQSLSEKEFKKMLKELHIKVNSSKLKELIKKYDANGNGTFDIGEFKQMIREFLRKPEVDALYKKYASKYKENEYTAPLMSIADLQKFFKQENKEQVDLESIRKFLPHLSSKKESDHCISCDNFNDILFSFNNSVFKKINRPIYQDMKRPLTDYYINSSHNTYLLGDQLTSKSSVQAYIMAINKGCRCVELDIWPEKGEPIIFHGHTFTSKIPFVDVIRGLKQHSFQFNPYPMILSFEMHCNVEVQGRIAQILKEEIGDQIYQLPETWENNKWYPSPHELQNKFLIKGKGTLVKSNTQTEIKDEGLDVLETEEDEDPNEASDNNNDSKHLIQKQESDSPGKSPGKKEEKKKGEKQHKVNPLLNKYYCMIGTKVRDLDQKSIWNIISLSEKKFSKIQGKTPEFMIQHNRKFLTRLYPFGLRFDSSNFDPVMGWLGGTQIVALNFQTSDEPTLLNFARFQGNGGLQCGYKLKPNYLRSAQTQEETKAMDTYTHQFTKPIKKLTIEVISGQQIRYENYESKEILDPCVEVKVVGNNSDTTSNPSKTNVIKDNGFHPYWGDQNDSKFTFNIASPEHAQVVFKVYDSDVIGKKKISWYAIDFEDISEGYRVVPLLTAAFQPLRHSYLFCKFTIENI